MPTDAPLDVEVWSDVICPWCRIGRAHLDLALAEFEHADRVRVTYRSFELEPNSPAEQDESVIDHLAAKYGGTTAQIEGMVGDVVGRGQALGIDFRFDIARTGNTFDAHRLLHLAREHGRQDELKGRLMDAYFTEGRPIGSTATLEEVAVESGLDRDEVRAVLSSDRYAADVRADEDEARALQVGGVPFFVFDRRLAASGAQPPEVLLGALRQAWQARETSS